MRGVQDSITLRFLPKPNKAYSDTLTAAILDRFSCYLYMEIKTPSLQNNRLLSLKAGVFPLHIYTFPFSSPSLSCANDFVWKSDLFCAAFSGNARNHRLCLVSDDFSFWQFVSTLVEFQRGRHMKYRHEYLLFLALDLRFLSLFVFSSA